MTHSVPFTHYDAAQVNPTTHLKPDTIDEVANDHTHTNLKPDTIDTPIYEKPNAYEDLEVNSEQVDDLALGIQSTLLDRPEEEEEEEDGEEPFLTTIVRYKTKKTKMAPPRTSTPPPSLPHTWSSSTLLSQVSTTTSATNTIIGDEELLNHHRRRPLSSSSLDQPQPISPSLSTTSTTDSLNSTTSSKQLLLDSLKRRPMADVAKYDLRKHGLTQPHHHDIYIGGTKHLLFRKRQPHSYSWGFQNILYRVEPTHSQNTTQYGTKIAETRRRAFQKQITVEWGLDDNVNNLKDDQDDDDGQAYKGGNGTEQEEEEEEEEMLGTRSNQLVNTNNTRLLFVYTTVFETDYCIRWKRPSLSHDMVCEIRWLEEDEEVKDEKARKHKKKKKWQVLAEFNSNLMGYLVHIGQLSVDKRVLALVDRPDHLEAHLLITCCTLVDLMREVVQKAVGLSDGGVA